MLNIQLIRVFIICKGAPQTRHHKVAITYVAMYVYTLFIYSFFYWITPGNIGHWV